MACSEQVAEPQGSSASRLVAGPTQTTAAEVARESRKVLHPLSGVAAIVEAEVSRLWNEYDERLGPRIFVELSDMIVHAGSAPSKNVFSQLGGPLPNGNTVEVEELPKLALGKRYIFFFGRQATAYSPIWASLAFRLEPVEGRTVVLNAEGVPVLRFSRDRVELGDSPVIDPYEEGAPSRHIATSEVTRTAATLREKVAGAMSVGDFVPAAVEATIREGGPLNQIWSIEPDPTERWDVRPGTSAL